MVPAELPCGPVAGLDAAHYLLERYRPAGRMSRPLRAFYRAKPLLPRRAQLALRRLYARRQARRAFPAWPIEPVLVEAERRELLRRLRDGGTSSLPVLDHWPEGRRFAAILTHDVEGPAGVENALRVQALERDYGFVSSWNFVAEWYPVPDGLFAALRERGGEIGLHGLRHDASLFRDRESFEAQLPRVHAYLERWGAVGFRSPATHRNADWMPELGCLYDSSFPDTDPFEPQAGGCCSIHPYFIGDLVELPITLPQDHTLWEVLRDPSLDRWAEKCEWIIRHRGLITLILHPDYVLTAERLGRYERFLAYLRGRVDRDAGWHALPRDVAAWWRARRALQEGGGDALPAGAPLVQVGERDGELVFSR
jgi:peptidoglycan/xylan/chitin deacetylase (PgdA/CDA1 family)